MTMLAHFAAASGGAVNYIENVFNAWLYTGTGANLTIVNGIDLSTRGGLVWLKSRSAATSANHWFFDTARGVNKYLQSQNTDAEGSLVNSLTAFNVNGFTLGTNGPVQSSESYVSWTFREQAKFFDVVTYTGTGSNRTIAHTLGSVPGCIIVKRTDTSGAWQVYHQSLANTQYTELNTTAAAATSATRWNSTTPTSTVFSLGIDATVNASGGTYVAYLFAHNAGGFGLSGADNVITCGSYTGNGSTTGPTVTLGYEPQWVMIKRAVGGTGNWNMFDNMRGLTVSGQNDAYLEANTSDIEAAADWIAPNATGFQITTTSSELNTSTDTYIYIAVRRGPMQAPTSGTSVFSPITYSGLIPGSGNVTNTSGFPIDLIWARRRNTTVSFGALNSSTGVLPRLTGGFRTGLTTAATPIMATVSTDAEATQNTGIYRASNTGFTITGDAGGLAVDTGSGETYIAECFRRAPGFFDVVCYTGTGTATTFSHNLGAIPELMIVKNRSNAENWGVYSAALGNTKRLRLNTTDAAVTDSGEWNNTTPTASVFTVGINQEVNFSANTYVAYLFATVAGVSKVGTYTGTGTTLQVNCGFTAGARFVLIKRTDDVGDWYVWDSARGIVAGNDPYLTFNLFDAEVTSTDYVDTHAAGFELSSTAPAAINANGGSFIFLAIA